MKIAIHLDRKKYSSKPEIEDIYRINNEITQEVTECEVHDLIEMVGKEGQTFMPGLMNGNRKNDNFVGQQVYALDFDSGISFEDFMKRANELELYPSFVYKTFSYTKENPKFRAVYINDCVFEEWKAAKILLKMLLYIYPEADKSCVDAARIFFGGKGVLYAGEKAVINVRDVAVCLQAYIAKKDMNNYGRIIKRIGNELGIRVEKGIFRILSECMDVRKNGSRPVYILGLNRKSSLFYYIEKNNIEKTHRAPEEYTPKKDIRLIQHKTISDIRECCPLVIKFYETELDHHLKFLLATNFVHIKGGKKLFFQGIHEHIEKWKADWKTIEINQYEPQDCRNGGCPYVEQCRCKNMCEKLERKITRVNHNIKYISLGEGEQLLKQYLSDAVNDEGKDIQLIKAQTALGKTYAYCQLASQRTSNSEKPLLIALPTIKLQNEVYDDLTDLGIDVYKTVSISNLLDEMNEDTVLV